MPPESSVGFAPADWALFGFTALLLAAAFVWRRGLQRALSTLALNSRACAVLVFALPIALRLLLLPRHPAPAAEASNEFSHLLVADTLLHGRLANPAHSLHQFFETAFVLQQPTYSSMYPMGEGAAQALGRLISGIPWTGVLIATGTFCAACYWMLRGWLPPLWALLGGIFAIVEFGPLCQWTNSYSGGSLAAAAGCLVFGALPRLRDYGRPRDALLLGIGLGISLLTQPFESLFLLAAVILFFVQRPALLRVCGFAAVAVIPLMLVMLLQNRAVTRSWTTLPEQLHTYQYGIPTPLTINPLPTPHVRLTAQQETEYKVESLQHGQGSDSLEKFLLRLEYRVRFYRFFFLPPLYLALFAFLFTLRHQWWLAATLAIFAFGTNLSLNSPIDSLAIVTSLFVLASVLGLREVSRIRIHNNPIGFEIATVLIVLSLGDFAGWYSLHLFENPSLYPLLRYETWDSLNHDHPQRRTAVKRQLTQIDGQLLVFVRYGPHHMYLNEWVWNEADIDHARIVFARDLGPQENEKLIHYYPKRKVLLLEPDTSEPKVQDYQGELH